MMVVLFKNTINENFKGIEMGASMFYEPYNEYNECII